MPPGGKRHLIQGEGSDIQISNELRPQDPVVVYVSPLPGLRCVRSWWILMAMGVVVRNFVEVVSSADIA